MQINYEKQISFRSAPPPRKLALDLASTVLSFRRPFTNETLSFADFGYLRNRIAAQITPFINKEEPIPMAIVGFPMKCPAPNKCISQSPDRAEFEALTVLKSITDRISVLYSPGSEFKIFTDGRIFVNTIVGSTDAAVTKYIEKLRSFLVRLQAKSIKLVTPDETLGGTFDEIRAKLFTLFPFSKEKMKAQCEIDPFLKVYKTYIRDFYAKDIRTLDPSKSIKASRKEAEDVALGVIGTAESLNKYIASISPQGFLRLSIHSKPFDDNSGKIGVYLNNIHANSPAPWHGAAIEIPHGNSTAFTYEKKCILEKAGCKLVEDTDGKGAYYRLPNNFNYNPDLSLKENILLNSNI